MQATFRTSTEALLARGLVVPGLVLTRGHGGTWAGIDAELRWYQASATARVKPRGVLGRWKGGSKFKSERGKGKKRSKPGAFGEKKGRSLQQK
eukprot:912436-Rhodomonas_salina.2